MLSSKPRISVIIPTYNRASFIGAAIDSVLSQKGFKNDIEVIVVDDGSTDNTAEILKNYGTKIRYFKIKHSGLPSSARNYGIKKSQGELIAFLDSDDLWVKDKLTSQAKLFDDKKIVLSFGQAETISSNGVPFKKTLTAKNRLTWGEDFSKLLKENVISLLTVIVRREALEKVGLFDESPDLKAIEDYELWLRVTAAYPGAIKAIKKTLAYYRIHEGNISSSGDLSAIDKILQVYNSLWPKPIFSKLQRSALEQQLEIMHQNWSRQQNIDGNTPVISVVMSMYNSEQYLRESISSILNQTYQDFEFIIIDDGCSDKSVEIVKSYDDPRIRLVHQLNHGLVFSFNKGLSLARAPYIARMDSDDVSLPTRFKKELNWLTSDDKRGLVGCFFAYVDKETRRTPVTMVWPTKHIDIQRTMYFVNPFGHGSVMMRKEAALEVGGYRAAYEPAEDFDLWSRVVQDWEVGEIPEILYLWRLHYKNVSHTDTVVQNKSADRIIKNLWEQSPADKPFWSIIRDARFYEHLDSLHSSRVRREYCDNQVRLSVEFLNHGEYFIGFKTALAAFFLSPKLSVSNWRIYLRAFIRYFRIRS